MAPWVETPPSEQQEAKKGGKGEIYGTIAISQHREDPSMTATMPYLAPWNDVDSIERGRASHDVLLSPLAQAHLSERRKYEQADPGTTFDSQATHAR